MPNFPLLIVSGPTASGKSALALRLAQAFNTDLINIDSVQTYAELEIGAAKPSLADREQVKHHLLGVFKPDQVINVAAYCEMAQAAIAELALQAKQPLLCGGSTLYISALIGGLATLPRSSAELRAELESFESAQLLARLEQVDPLSAKRLHPNDRVRVIRALEASLLSGEGVSDLLSRHNPKHNRFGAVLVVPLWDREALYARINRRTQQMLNVGLIAEVQKLVTEYGAEAQALRSLGYAQTLSYLAGEIDRAALQERIAMHTRRFAKRQLTFWRNEPAKRGWSVRPNCADRELRTLSSSAARPSELIKELSCLSLDFEQLLGALKQRLNTQQNSCEVWFVDAERLVQ